MIQETEPKRYSLVVRNRPGELVKLTRLLSDAGISVCAMRVANLGRKAAIQFTMPRGSAVPRGLNPAEVD